MNFERLAKFGLLFVTVCASAALLVGYAVYGVSVFLAPAVFVLGFGLLGVLELYTRLQHNIDRVHQTEQELRERIHELYTLQQERVTRQDEIQKNFYLSLDELTAYLRSFRRSMESDIHDIKRAHDVYHTREMVELLESLVIALREHHEEVAQGFDSLRGEVANHDGATKEKNHTSLSLSP